VEVARERLEVWKERHTSAQDVLDGIRGALVEVEAERDRFLETELDSAPELADARAVATVDGHDLSLVALDAYVAAAEATDEADPGCRLHWTLLAGIGRIETAHGTFGGTELGPDGVTDDRILGIALTGGGGTAHISDTDGGALDGDTTYDRAVGPMQFIPSTWVRWARDGDGDGKADPHNIYDASLSAAEYLCASGPGLDTLGGRARAILSYNRSQAYVADVSAQADGYRSIRL
jgi:membrane-bound lytic murein transglycosylase B